MLPARPADASPPRSATARATSTRRASSTRAGPRAGSSSRSPGTTARTSPSPARATDSRTLKAAQALGDLQSSARRSAPGLRLHLTGKQSQALPQLRADGPGRDARGSDAHDGMPSHDESCTLVIFGASGDLTKRKLIPALWSLFQSRVLPEPFAVIGVSRSEMTNEQFRTRMREAITDFARVQPPSARVWDRFAQALFYYTGDPADPALYPGLATLPQAGRAGARHQRQPALLRLDPALGLPAPRHAARRGGPPPADRGRRRLGAHRHREAVRTRPRAPRALNQVVSRVFTEDQVYRIDHYLGQGDGPEHPGLPLRQRHLRAALEPQPRGPRADHGGRDASGSRAAAPTTRSRARCAT